jgi:hypothetical protein
LRCNSSEIDFGEVKVGEQASHIFEIVNHRGTEVRISKIVPGCTCTAVATAPDRLAAGETGRIALVLTVDQRGPFTQSVSVVTDDLLGGPLILKLKGIGKGDLEVQPGSIEIPRDLDEFAKATITLSYKGDLNSFKIRQAFSKDPNISVRKETLEDGRVYRLRVGLKGNSPALGSTVAITVVTNLPRESVVSIPIVVKEKLEQVDPRSGKSPDPNRAAPHPTAPKRDL